MKEEKKAVAAATKNETANAATSAAKTTTPSTAAAVKPAAAKQGETKPETKPATAAPAPAKAEATKPNTAEPQKDTTAKIEEFKNAMQKRESIEEMQKRLNDELQRLNRKKELADKRGVFLTCEAKINEYLEMLDEETEFETSVCRLTFEIFEKDNYGRESFKDFMTISNAAILTKFCNALKQEIAERVAELETELLSA